MSFPTFAEIKKSFSLVIHPNDVPEPDQRVIAGACQITDPQNLPQSEEEYYDCAQKLRAIGAYSPARAILSSLLRSSDLTMKAKARESLLDSLGDGGNWFHCIAHRLTFGSIPLRDWSDQDEAGAVRDVLIFSSLQALGVDMQPAYTVTRRLSRKAEQAEDLSRFYDRDFDHRR